MPVTSPRQITDAALNKDGHRIADIIVTFDPEPVVEVVSVCVGFCKLKGEIHHPKT